MSDNDQHHHHHQPHQPQPPPPQPHPTQRFAAQPPPPHSFQVGLSSQPSTGSYTMLAPPPGHPGTRHSNAQPAHHAHIDYGELLCAQSLLCPDIVLCLRQRCSSRAFQFIALKIISCKNICLSLASACSRAVLCCIVIFRRPREHVDSSDTWLAHVLTPLVSATSQARQYIAQRNMYTNGRPWLVRAALVLQACRKLRCTRRLQWRECVTICKHTPRTCHKELCRCLSR